MSNVINLADYRCDKHIEESGSCYGCDFFEEDKEGIYCKLGAILEWHEETVIIEVIE